MVWCIVYGVWYGVQSTISSEADLKKLLAVAVADDRKIGAVCDGVDKFLRLLAVRKYLLNQVFYESVPILLAACFGNDSAWYELRSCCAATLLHTALHCMDRIRMIISHLTSVSYCVICGRV